MKHDRDIRPIRVPARTVHTVEGGKGLQITAVQGAVWITQARDERDIVLSRGQSFILDREGLAVVYALKDDDATIVVGPAGHITAAEFGPAKIRQAGA